MRENTSVFMTAANDILLRRRHDIIMPPCVPGQEEDCMPEIGAMMKNVQNLGFTFGQALISRLRRYNRDTLVSFYQELIPELKSMVGADKEYTPMYPNFPEQVMEADDVELFINALVHYWSAGTVLPEYEKKERFPLLGNKELTVIDLGGTKELMEIFTALLGSKTSLSEQDKADLATFVNETEYAKYMPDSIPMKENVAFFGNLLLKQTDCPDAKILSPYFKTATDVLRLLAALSDADISLSSGKIRIRKLNRKERRFIMDLLAGCGNLKEDMFRYKGLWVKAGEIIHPGEFAKAEKYAQVLEAFRAIRSNDKPLFFEGQVEKALSDKNVGEAIALLSRRPGEFARRLDELLRLGGGNEVPAAFAKVAEKVSTPVLWQVREHFAYRLRNMAGAEKDIRVFFPKGNTAKVFVNDNALEAIPKEACVEIIKACDAGIAAQYAAREPMGKVFVDKEFDNHIVPFSQRSASSAFKMLTRGSRIPLSDKAKVVRPFIWWTNMENGLRVDIDLSVTFLTEDWKYMTRVSYTNLRNNSIKCYHSGDIVDGGAFGGKGVSEFIDISPEDVVARGGRYALVQVYAFTHEPFSQLPCSFGWMEREDFKSGEIFEPSTVEQNMAVTSNARVVIPVIIDCKERLVYWADIACTEREDFWGNNAESNLRGTSASAYAIVNMARPSMYDVVTANARARGTLVETREDADIIFSNDTTKPVVTVSETDEDGNTVEKQVEKDVVIHTVYDLDYYMQQV